MNAAHHDGGGDVAAGVLICEVEQRLLTEAVQKHRFVVFLHLYAGQLAVRRHADQQPNGFAGKALQAGVVGRFKGIAEQLVELKGLINRRRALLLDQAGGTGKQLLHRGLPVSRLLALGMQSGAEQT